MFPCHYWALAPGLSVLNLSNSSEQAMIFISVSIQDLILGYQSFFAAWISDWLRNIWVQVFSFACLENIFGPQNLVNFIFIVKEWIGPVLITSAIEHNRRYRASDTRLKFWLHFSLVGNLNPVKPWFLHL